jgi:hypothetical protein
MPARLVGAGAADPHLARPAIEVAAGRARAHPPNAGIHLHTLGQPPGHLELRQGRIE